MRENPGKIVFRVVHGRSVRFAIVPATRSEDRSAVFPLFTMADLDGMTVTLSPPPVRAVPASVPHYPVEIPDEATKARMIAQKKARMIAQNERRRRNGEQ